MHSNNIVLLFMLVGVLVCCSGSFLVDLKTRAILDSFGRERIFHGVNVVYKGVPYVPITDHFDSTQSFSEQDYQILAEAGMNVIRLGVMWPGVEPTRGNYNYTYLGIIQNIVSRLESYGIFVLLDCHQDVMSEKFCGEGVPMWAAQPAIWANNFPLPLAEPYHINNQTKIPSTDDCNKKAWADYYASAATSSAFQNLYDNYDGLLDSFAAYWQLIAKLFSKYDNVLGYELLNEPWAGDIYENPELLVPGVADLKNLAPVYERLHTAIRQVDQEGLIFFEPVTWDDAGVGFENVPGGDHFKNRTVLSYHLYVPPDVGVDEAFAVRCLDIERLGCGGFLTEFDISPASNEKGISHTANQADFYKQSWIGWEYKPYVPITGFGYSFFYPNGSTNNDLISLVSRTYPIAVTGHILSFDYNPNTFSFKLEYYLDERKWTVPTEIYINQNLNYYLGFTVEATPNSAVEVNTTHNRVFVWHKPNAKPDKITVLIEKNGPNF